MYSYVRVRLCCVCHQGMDINKLVVPGQKLYSLPFDVVLNNNIALSYFIGQPSITAHATWPSCFTVTMGSIGLEYKVPHTYSNNIFLDFVIQTLLAQMYIYRPQAILAKFINLIGGDRWGGVRGFVNETVMKQYAYNLYIHQVD